MTPANTIRLEHLAAAFALAATANQVADVVVTQGLAAVDATLGIVAVLNVSRTEFISLRIMGCPPDVANGWRRFPANAHVPIADAVRDNRPVFLPTLEERQARYPVPYGGRLGRALVAQPIRQGDVAGALGFTFLTDRLFGEGDCLFFGHLADLCGRALERVGPWSPPLPRKCRVLVVDDLRDASDSMAILLRLSGHEVRVAYDGRRALEIAREFRPEAVLLDLGLPGMTGFEVATSLRQEPGFEQTLLVAVTGYGQAEDRRRTHEAGFDIHLVKPADLTELQAVLAKVAPTP